MAKTKGKTIPIIDLFAGPGGLSEGFSAFRTTDGRQPFRIALSIEKDPYAHHTLALRSFFRQFETGRAPHAYYDYLRKTDEPEPDRRKRLYSAFPEQAQWAEACTLRAELGKDDPQTIRESIRCCLDGRGDFVLLGGPPCQAYSIMGRSRNRGNPDYDASADQRQRLYVEYLQVLADHHPAVFVMENVKGVLSATLENERIFERILDDLRSPCEAILREGRALRDGRRTTRYRIVGLVQAPNGDSSDLRRFVIQMEKHGIPQGRHRAIVIGLREDLGAVDIDLLAEVEEVPARKVLCGLPAVRSGLSRETDGLTEWKKRVADMRLRAFLNDAPNSIDPRVADAIMETLESLNRRNLSRGGEFVRFQTAIDYRPEWFLDRRLNGVCNHTARLHIADDLHRYLFASCYADINSLSPNLRDFPHELFPKHRNAKKYAKNGWFDDRFHVQIPDCPSTTVTCHLAKDGHYFIHPDARQCRSMTVREVARLQTFPDNYFFCGPRTAQYIQVGNAVPPLLAYQIAENVFAFLTECGLIV